MYIYIFITWDVQKFMTSLTKWLAYKETEDKQAADIFCKESHLFLPIYIIISLWLNLVPSNMSDELMQHSRETAANAAMISYNLFLHLRQLRIPYHFLGKVQEDVSLCHISQLAENVIKMLCNYLKVKFQKFHLWGNNCLLHNVQTFLTQYSHLDTKKTSWKC